MCGIFCLSLDANHNLDAAILTRLTREMLLIAERRGREAAGVCTYQNGRTFYIKRPSSASAIVRGPEFAEFSQKAFVNPDNGGVAIIGHARLVTNGLRAFHDNNQPFDDKGFVGVHNGVIVNHSEFFAPDLPVPELDSLAIPTRLRHHLDAGNSAEDANVATLNDLQGVVSYLMVDTVFGQIHAASNNGSLYEARLMRDGAPVGRILMSEREMLRLMEAHLASVGIQKGDVRRYDPGTVDSWCVTDDQKAIKPAATTKPVDLSALTDPRKAELRRCTNCLLPHTMPFIEFDDAGVCNWCRNSLLTPLKERDELDAQLEKLRNIIDRPNCLMAVSGGRDSCYGLHVAKTELGLNPIAFTYDWGMVTDLARRNTSRVCAKLGIEHIIVSADIPRKQENIRKNIEAWLKRPELGMVPIFTAGDKQFYQHANRLQKELDVPAIIFCENGRYEKTWFKAGFAGINEGNRRLWNLSMIEKFRYMSYYAGQFLRNPAYLNRSLLDSIEAFISSYFLKHDYIQLFDYIPWEEETVERVLIDEYGFEVPEGCPTTWRIGDGTAPFYNFIYRTVAGFTEFDTFRSNQIRDGKITREFGAERIQIENEPRMDDLREYLATVGVNFDKAMTRILSIPRRY
ncbi:lipopolysaccharide biosynthesis protein [Ruegeria conchae]|uniref:Glutamine amidotransferase-like protein n=1 Tax=Ruegeria conchae TaxID=981384 RepID=A0A497Z588_9RHOB|nr:lipopolysaccharide biosynthesis protein [Ruegeria conchae]RLK03561.1 glutamine amidotransferase-like protein [Ruegeria conchae]